ncbi:uncharacterized protein LOC128964334 [Oppia nitens]|uniref:uncharacterized protein LOC128964334 n=1 Tax=Oppia nitens TaxID=1686743 RepID=UPI0023DCA26F|nr:uncharacterized protein LOC128964334 [Oppia nitens]
MNLLTGKLLLLLLCTCTVFIVNDVDCISVHLDRYRMIIGDRCFNETYAGKPWTLGQQYPVGMSIDNVISLIEKVESRRPDLMAKQVVIMLLKRFHIDGLHLTGNNNQQSQVEMKHRRITEEIIEWGGVSAADAPEFPEEVLTEDEKCALFFALSHTVNETAGHDDDIQHVYHRTVHLSRAPAKLDANKTLSAGKKVMSGPVQSEFLPKIGAAVANKTAKTVKSVAAANVAVESRQMASKEKQTAVVDEEEEEEEDDEEVPQKPQKTQQQPQRGKRIRRQASVSATRPVASAAAGSASITVQRPSGSASGSGSSASGSQPSKGKPITHGKPVSSVPISNISPPTVRLTRRPRERGVVSFLNDRTTAIAANRVLLGAAVGLLQPPARAVRDLIKKISNIDTTYIPDGQVDPLMAVTLSDLLGIDAGSGLTIPRGDVLFGAEGEWNSTACQTSYRLKSNGTLATLAELRGGLDGYNIGRRLPTLLNQYPTMSLSQILRQYYSSKGLASDSGVCNRGYGLSTELNNKVSREAENYIRLWNGVFYEGTFQDNQLTGFVQETWQSFQRFLNKAGNDKSSDERTFCMQGLTGSDIKTAPLETSADVLFMLDNMGARGQAFDEELELITRVSRSLYLSRTGGSISVLVNSQGVNNLPNIVDDNNQQLNTPLYALAYNTTSSQCATCRAAWFENNQMGITDRALLMELINRTLTDFDRPTETLAAIPSKSFVWFDFGNMKPAPTDREQKRKYDDFKWRLRYENRDTNIFMATLNNEDIKDLLARDSNWIQMGTGNVERNAETLAKYVQQTPQVFQYSDCWTRKSDNYAYDGYLTPGYKQYWAMYPEYFIKSYTIDMKFKAENAKIKVCLDRYPNAENDTNRCSEATEDGGEVTFTRRNPCQGKTFASCPALHFTIGLTTTSSSASQANNQCTDVRCRSPDQIKWTFTHTGVSCNPASSLLPNWSYQLIALIVALVVINNNIKIN